MPRRTPVKELLQGAEAAVSSPLRRSSRLSSSAVTNPPPSSTATKKPTRRSSTDDAASTPIPKTAKTRRASYSQETENEKEKAEPKATLNAGKGSTAEPDEPKTPSRRRRSTSVDVPQQEPRLTRSRASSITKTIENVENSPKVVLNRIDGSESAANTLESIAEIESEIASPPPAGKVKKNDSDLSVINESSIIDDEEDQKSKDTDESFHLPLDELASSPGAKEDTSPSTHSDKENLISFPQTPIASVKRLSNVFKEKGRIPSDPVEPMDVDDFDATTLRHKSVSPSYDYSQLKSTPQSVNTDRMSSSRLSLKKEMKGSPVTGENDVSLQKRLDEINAKRVKTPNTGISEDITDLSIQSSPPESLEVMLVAEPETSVTMPSPKRKLDDVLMVEAASPKESPKKVKVSHESPRRSTRFSDISANNEVQNSSKIEQLPEVEETDTEEHGPSFKRTPQSCDDVPKRTSSRLSQKSLEKLTNGDTDKASPQDDVGDNRKIRSSPRLSQQFEATPLKKSTLHSSDDKEEVVATEDIKSGEISPKMKVLSVRLTKSPSKSPEKKDSGDVSHETVVRERDDAPNDQEVPKAGQNGDNDGGSPEDVEESPKTRSSTRLAEKLSHNQESPKKNLNLSFGEDEDDGEAAKPDESGELAMNSAEEASGLSRRSNRMSGPQKRESDADKRGTKRKAVSSSEDEDGGGDVGEDVTENDVASSPGDENVDDHETSLQMKIRSLIAHSLIENVEDDDSDDDDFLVHMAEEGEEDTPSEDSNEIIDKGESIGSESDHSKDDEDESIDGDSFIDDDVEIDLLPGDEYDLEISPKKKSRIRNLADEDSDGGIIEFDQKTTAKSPEKRKHSRIIQNEDSSENGDEDDDLVAATNDEEPKCDEVAVTPSKQSEEVDNGTKNRIVILENIRIDNMEDPNVSDRISKVVELFCSNLKSKGDISVNVSFDYEQKSPAGDESVKEKLLTNTPSLDDVSDEVFKPLDSTDKSTNTAQSESSHLEVSLDEKPSNTKVDDGIVGEVKQRKKKRYRKRRHPQKVIPEKETDGEGDNKKKKIESDSLFADEKSAKENRSSKSIRKSIELPRESSLNPASHVIGKKKKYVINPANILLQEETLNVLDQALRHGKKKVVVPVFKPSCPKRNDTEWLVSSVKKKVKPSRNNIISEEIHIKPSTSTMSQYEFHAKDFKNRTLFDQKRVKRVDTKQVLKKKGGAY